MIYRREFKGKAKVILSDAYVFEAVELDDVEPSKYYYSDHVAWDTGSEVTLISPRVVDSLKLKPITRTAVMGIGGVEEVTVYKVHLGLPNDFLYEDMTVYCGDIDDYDILIGMDLISLSDFFLTNVDGNNRFYYQMPAVGKIEE